MNSIPLPPPTWVANASALRTMLAALRSQPLIAVDTESNSLFAYKEQVCLIQFSTPERDYLVDPLVLRNIAELGEIFSTPKIEKIFHAAEYDLICLKRDYEFTFNNIFDTMHASRILSRSEVGLAGILNSELGITIEKRFQRANWGERPLPAAMLAYARLDTHYLIDLRNHLRNELNLSGLLELAEEDFNRLTLVNVPANENGPVNCWKLIGKNTLPPQQCAVLQALIEYRDQQARRADLPLFKIFGNQTLIEIARACPTTLEELAEATHLTTRQMERHGQGLLQAVNQGSTSRPPVRHANHRPDDAVLTRIDKLKDWRKLTARELKVESDVVLPKDLAEAIAYANPSTLEGLEKLMSSTPWRFKRYGLQILNILEQIEKQKEPR